ncbi:MAG: hypothetical protein IRY94_17685, partial [Rhodospirillaceae bacterium]|nr:hypothetical protein [Rhodospirillaceae bacterium]
HDAHPRLRIAGERIKVLAAVPVAEAGGGPPGRVLDAAPTVACGAGSGLRLLRLQREGRTALDAAAFLRGYPLPPGTMLDG